MRILLTNDDSHRSPLLKFIIDALKEISELTIVVPAHEQSWRGKSMTRFENLHLGEIDLFGHRAYTVDGTPADCANIGIYNLSTQKPDLVVSGINTGLNTGTSFIFCSGTVGACFEANIAGVPAIALSQEFDTAARNEYALEYTLSTATIAHLERQTKGFLSRILPVFTKNRELLAAPKTWNINFPYRARESWEIVPCPLDKIRYGSFFAKKESIFEHSLTEVIKEGADHTDAAIVARGDVSITPLDIHSFGPLAATDAVKYKALFADDKLSG